MLQFTFPENSALPFLYYRIGGKKKKETGRHRKSSSTSHPTFKAPGKPCPLPTRPWRKSLGCARPPAPAGSAEDTYWAEPTLLSSSPALWRTSRRPHPAVDFGHQGHVDGTFTPSPPRFPGSHRPGCRPREPPRPPLRPGPLGASGPPAPGAANPGRPGRRGGRGERAEPGGGKEVEAVTFSLPTQGGRGRKRRNL